MANKRRLQRFKRRWNVKFRSTNGQQRSAFTGDVCRDGLFVTCASPEMPGRLLEIGVELPGVGEAQVTGQVTWVRKVPRELQSFSKGGFGVEIRFSDDAWNRFFEGLERPAAAQ